MERVDGLLRLTRIHYILWLDKEITVHKTWRPVLDTFTFADAQAIAQMENDVQAVLRYLLLDATNANSLFQLLNKARENARGAQDHLTKEVWEEVNGMYHLINDASLPRLLSAYEGMKVIEGFTRHTVSYAGITQITMPRGTGWDFMNLGKYMERCLQTIAITEKELGAVPLQKAENDIFIWRHLLLSLSGYELHLKTYRTAYYNQNVMHQVVLNENFTRSILYSLKHIHIYLKRLTAANSEASAPLLRSFGRLHSKVRYLDPETLTDGSLERFLIEVKEDLHEFGKAASAYFFSYT
jgi:uncharacterized alpha-E superfamily protein